MRGREKSSENAVTSGPSVWGGWFGQPLARVLPQYAPLVARQAGSESEVFASLPSLLTSSLLPSCLLRTFRGLSWLTVPSWWVLPQLLAVCEEARHGHVCS